LVRTYIETKYTIEERSDVSFLQNLNNWKIAEAIMEAGTRGITSKKLSEELGISYNIVADTTRQLAQLEWIVSEPPKKRVGRPKSTEKLEFRKPANLHHWNLLNPYAPQIEETFRDYCFKTFNDHAGDLKAFVHLFDSIILETKSSERFYPTETIHEECGWSHEGLEFIRGLMYALAEWLESDSDYQAVLKKYKIAEDKAFQYQTG
jgi:hypothetical protein